MWSVNATTCAMHPFTFETDPLRTIQVPKHRIVRAPRFILFYAKKTRKTSSSSFGNGRRRKNMNDGIRISGKKPEINGFLESHKIYKIFLVSNLSLTLSLSHSNTHSLLVSHTLSHSHTHTQTQIHTHSLSPSHSYTHTLLRFTLSLSLTHNLSQKHTNLPTSNNKRKLNACHKKMLC